MQIQIQNRMSIQQQKQNIAFGRQMTGKREVELFWQNVSAAASKNPKVNESLSKYNRIKEGIANLVKIDIYNNATTINNLKVKLSEVWGELNTFIS